LDGSSTYSNRHIKYLRTISTIDLRCSIPLFPMRRDSIFYRLFQQSPPLLFQLLDSVPEQAENYRFDSVAVKEPTFTIDGVFLPPESETPGVVYFCEVQLQKDEVLYERLFGESFLYFYRNRAYFFDWQAVVIYPSRSTEQRQTAPYEDLLNSRRVHRIYLDELGNIQDSPLEIALMLLTMADETDAPTAAKSLLTRTQQEVTDSQLNSAIIEMIKTIMIYKFTNLSRDEVEAMLDITIQETRIYRDAKQEGKQELVLRLLTKRFGKLPDAIATQVQTCSAERLNQLGEALLDFAAIADLEAWLEG
jgi:predicted transposase/invertase (TIGR01784 family)